MHMLPPNALFADAHRPFFLAGVLFALANIGLWLLHLGGAATYAWNMPQARIHMAQMVYFFFPFFFLGFLFTVFPRLLSTRPFAATSCRNVFFCYFTGALLFTAGLYAGFPLLQLGIFLAAGGLVAATFLLVAALMASTYPHKEVPRFVCLGIAMGCAGMGVLAYGATTDNESALALCEAIGIYGFLLPTIYAVAYQMVPIFTAVSGRDVRRRRFGLHGLFTLSLLRMLLTMADANAYYWVTDLGLCIVIADQLGQWRIWRPKHYLIQSVLHWAMAWFPLAFALSAAASIGEWLTGGRWPLLEQAALHTLVLGGFGTLLLGMTTRLALGHAGRKMLTDAWTGYLFIIFQLAPVLRVGCGALSEFWPPCHFGIYLSGGIWLLVFLLWLLLYAPFIMLNRKQLTQAGGRK